MKVKNKIPESKILSESKINPQSLNDFMKDAGIKDDWLESHHKRNLNVKLSDVEKLPEVFHCLNNDEPELTFEFNKTINRSLLKNVFVSVGFNNVTKDFIYELSQTTELQIQVASFKDDISFWVNPCLMDNDKASMFYGFTIAETSKKIDELRKYIETESEGTKEEKDAAVKRLYPMASQTSCIVSGSLYDWQKLIYEGTEFNRLDELRFVLIGLTRKFKLKYNSLFYNFILVDKNGEEFGLDTVNSDDNGWRKFKVKIRGV